MTINGVAVTWVSGVDLPNNAGDSGNFKSTQLGTQDVIITYGSSLAGQRITFTDSDNVVTCQTLTGGSGTFPIYAAAVTALGTLNVSAEDGVCP